MTAAVGAAPPGLFRSLVLICLAIATSIAIFALMPLLIRRTLQQSATNLPRPVIVVPVVIQPPVESIAHPERGKPLQAPSSQPPPMETKVHKQKSQEQKPLPSAPKKSASRLQSPTRRKQKTKIKVPRQPASKLPPVPLKSVPLKPESLNTETGQAPSPPAPAEDTGAAIPFVAPPTGSRSKATSVPASTKTHFEAHEVDRLPLPVIHPEPKYPYRLQRRKIEGHVNVRFLVSRDGHPRHLSILEANPKGFFEKSVLQTVPKWRFKPGLKSGRPVDTWIETTIRFTLKS